MSGKGRVRRRPKDGIPVQISREELAHMHRSVDAVVKKGGSSEAYSLLYSLGACLGNWPRVRREKAKELRRRFRELSVNRRDACPKKDNHSFPSREFETGSESNLPCKWCQKTPSVQMKDKFGDYEFCRACLKVYEDLQASAAGKDCEDDIGMCKKCDAE